MRVDEDYANVQHVGFNQGWNTHPNWSPDGHTITFASDNRAYDFVYDVYSMDANGANIRPLLMSPFTSNTFYFQPTWSPDGTKLAAVECSHGWMMCTPTSRIVIANADGTNLRTLVTDGDGFATPAWSPDGKLIAYNSRACPACPPSIRYVGVDGFHVGPVIGNAHSVSWRK